MALIKCNECGQMVSDKAGSCPNCGCPVEKRIVCEECGAIISASQSTCPNCGSPCGGSTSVDATQDQGTRKVNLTLLDLQLTKTGASGRGRMPFVIFALWPISSILGLHWFHIGKIGTGICNILIYVFCWPISAALLSAAFDGYNDVSYLCIIFGILFILPPIILFFLTFFIGIRAFFMPQEQFEEQYVNSYSFFPL